MDTTLILTIAIIVVSALLGGYLNGRRRDRCLANFEGANVSLELSDGRQIWGTLHIESSGLELTYAQDYFDDDQHVETTFLFYKDEFPQIQSVFRFCDQLDEDEWKTRAKLMDRTFHPRPWARLRRRTRNGLSLAAESLGQAIGAIVGSGKSGATFINDDNQDYFTNLGSNLIGYVGTTYDPLLERYIGTKVVVESTENNGAYERVGIFKDYTADFLQVLDVSFPFTEHVTLAPQNSQEKSAFFQITRSGKSLHVDNLGNQPILLESVFAGEHNMSINAVLGEKEDFTFDLIPELANGEIEAQLKITRQLDWIVPRTHALIRHKAERYHPDQVLSVGTGGESSYTPEEKQLQKKIDENPDDANSAVELAQELLGRGRLNQAERWFNYALERKQFLADNGKLAQRQLRYIKLKRSDFYR